MTPQEICILSLPRSGTNYVCSALWSLDAHWCFYELFSPAAVFGAEAFTGDLGQRLGMEIATIETTELVNYAREHPLALLDHLAALVAARGMASFSYKLFPTHLDAATLDSLLRRDGLTVVRLDRNPIDTFISRLKVEKTGKWSGTPTSCISVELDFDEFQCWHRTASRWFHDAGRVLDAAGTRTVRLRYETDVTGDPDHLLGVFHDTVLRRPEAAPRPRVRPGSLIERQDRSESYDRKVSNWAEFCARARDEDALDNLFVY